MAPWGRLAEQKGDSVGAAGEAALSAIAVARAADPGAGGAGALLEIRAHPWGPYSHPLNAMGTAQGVRIMYRDYTT